MEVGEISVEGVARSFRVHARDARTLKDLFVQRGQTQATDVWALRDVSAEIARGEAVGLIGRNGSGKTTLLRVIAGIIKPTAGRARTEGRIVSLLELIREPPNSERPDWHSVLADSLHRPAYSRSHGRR